jgi:hypothetical protein
MKRSLWHRPDEFDAVSVNGRHAAHPGRVRSLPDNATGVVVTFAISDRAAGDTPCATGCPIATMIRAGEHNFSSFDIEAPVAGSSVTVTVSASSTAASDPNFADNSATATIPVSAEPDLYASIDYLPDRR